MILLLQALRMKICQMSHATLDRIELGGWWTLASPGALLTTRINKNSQPRHNNWIVNNEWMIELSCGIEVGEALYIYSKP